MNREKMNIKNNRTTSLFLFSENSDTLEEKNGDVGLSNKIITNEIINDKISETINTVLPDSDIIENSLDLVRDDIVTSSDEGIVGTYHFVLFRICGEFTPILLQILR